MKYKILLFLTIAFLATSIVFAYLYYKMKDINVVHHKQIKFIAQKKLSPINEYLKQHMDTHLRLLGYRYFPVYKVLDSLQLNSLKSTLFFAGDPNSFDDNDYVIIRDNLSMQYYKMVIEYWPTYNMKLPDNLQLKVIDNDENGKVLKPVNYEINGLEYFINQCIALENKNLDPASIDTIIRFYKKEFVKINSPSEIDSLIDLRLKLNKENKANFKIITEKKRKILKDKVIRKNVLLYRYKYKWSTGFDYFEINPGQNAYNYPHLINTKLPRDTIFLTSRIPGNNYNIVYLRL